MPEGQTDVGQVPYIVPQRSAAPRLLFHPAKADDEGPCGYTMRLADRNRVSVSDIYGLLGSESLGFFSGGVALARVQALALLAGRARCCPHCLVSRKRWMSAWEIAHADACPDCGHWLVDQCSRCSKPLSWARPRLLECQCGNSLITERQGEAPAAVVALAATLFSIHRGNCVETAPLACMGLADAVDAIRFLGSLVAGVPKSRILSEFKLDPLDLSWTVTTAAAEVLSDWPNRLWTSLDRIRESHPEDQRGQLLRLFSPVYASLYRGADAHKLEPIREGFEAYLVQKWPGQLVKRHRRIGELALPEPSWLRVRQAARLIGCSTRTLHQMVKAQDLEAQTWQTSGGRSYMLIRKSDIEALLLERGRLIDLNEAARRLGLAESRASKLLSSMHGVVPPLWNGGRWNIPEQIVIKWEAYVEKLPSSFLMARRILTLKDCLKYILPNGDTLVNILRDVEAGVLPVLGKVSRFQGVSAIAFEKGKFNDWLLKQNQNIKTCTVRDFAKQLQIKEEVAYAIARSDMLKTTMARVGRRIERHTTQAWITDFESKYIFGSRVAALLKTSSSKLRNLLDQVGVHPIAGPGVDACRQIIYERAIVEKALINMNLAQALLNSLKSAGFDDGREQS